MTREAPTRVSSSSSSISRFRANKIPLCAGLQLLAIMLACVSRAEVLVLARSLQNARSCHPAYTAAFATTFGTRRHYHASRPSRERDKRLVSLSSKELGGRKRDERLVSLSSKELGGRKQFNQESYSSEDGNSDVDADQDDKPKKVKNYDRPKKRKKKKEDEVPLYRADRVLGNRTGKTRSECFKLLKHFAISIVDEDDETSNESTEETDVSKLNFRRLRGPKERIPMNARLYINQKIKVPALPPLLTVFHKPKWTLSTMGEDPKGRRNLQGLSFPYSENMHPVGRLDYDTNGLLLFSSSGPLTQTLLHPKHGKEKEYVAVVAGTVEQDKLQSKLKAGVKLADLSRAAKQEETVEDKNSSTGHKRPTVIARAELRDVNHLPTSDVPGYLADIKKNLPEEYNVTDLNLRGYMDVFKATELSEVRLVVKEGKHRMVRRMLASCGHPVVSLTRERLGTIELGDLEEGSFRNLTTKEENWAQSLVSNK